MISPNIHKGRWSKSEDQALTEAVQYFQKLTNSEPLPWNGIAENIPHRTGIQCQARFTEALDPAVRKGRWYADEDELLSAAISKYGCCWIRVASMIPTRTQRQCRTRWNQTHLQRLKINSTPNKSLSRLKATSAGPKHIPPIKFKFMPSISSTKEYQRHPLAVNDDSYITASNSPIIDNHIAQYTLNNDIISSSSSRSSQPTYHSSTSIGHPSIPTPIEQTPSNILQHEEQTEQHQQLMDLFPMMTVSKKIKCDDQTNTVTGDRTSMSSLLLTTDLDFLLNCLGSQINYNDRTCIKQ